MIFFLCKLLPFHPRYTTGYWMILFYLLINNLFQREESHIFRKNSPLSYKYVYFYFFKFQKVQADCVWLTSTQQCCGILKGLSHHTPSQVWECLSPGSLKSHLCQTLRLSASGHSSLLLLSTPLHCIFSNTLSLASLYYMIFGSSFVIDCVSFS